MAASPVEVKSEIKSPAGQRVQLDELRNRFEWSLLSPAQAKFCEVYIQSGADGGVYDTSLAMHSAYKSSSETNFRNLTYEVLANKRIRDVLNTHFAVAPIDAFLTQLSDAIRIEKGVAKLAAMRLYADIQNQKLNGDVSGWGAPAQPLPAEPVPAEPPAFKVDDVCVQNNQKYRVTEVDADGKVLAAQEIE